MRSERKGPQANAKIPEGFPIKRCPPAVPFDVNSFLTNILADINAKETKENIEPLEREQVGRYLGRYGSTGCH